MSLNQPVSLNGSRTSQLHRIAKALFWISLGITGLYLSGELLFYLLLDYPFNLYEPEVAIEAWQLSQGKPIYNDPVTGPHAGLYAPFFQLTGALLFQLLPDSLSTLRAISATSLLLIGYVSWKHSAHHDTLQLLVGFLLVLMWHKSVNFFDLQAKPDSYAILWVTLSLFSGIWYGLTNQVRYALLSALCLVLALFTKQTMLFAFPPLFLTLFIHRSYKPAFIFTALFGLFVAAGWFLFRWTTGEFLSFYLFELPGTFQISFGRIAIAGYTLLSTPWFLLVLYLAGRQWLKGAWNSKDTALITSIFFALPASIATFAKDGGASNAFLPFFVLCSVYLIGRLPIRAMLRGASFAGTTTTGRSTLLLLAAFLFVLTIQINPAHYISRFGNRVHAHNAYEELASKLSEAEGMIYSPYDNYLGMKVGHPVYRSYRSQRDLFYTGVRPEQSIAEFALGFDHVVTMTIDKEGPESSISAVLKRNNYSYFSSFQMDQSRSYHWWKRDQAPANE